MATRMHESTWEVPSGSTVWKVYTVDVEAGLSMCPSGNQGGLAAKHEASLNKHFNTHFPDVPIISAVERHNLAKLALGDGSPGPTFLRYLFVILLNMYAVKQSHLYAFSLVDVRCIVLYS